MNRIALVKFLLAALAVLLAAPAHAAEKWLRADTHNFIIYSSGSRSQLHEFAEGVELFDALLRLRTNTPRDPNPNRLTIYMLAQPADVSRLVEDKKRMVAGIYLPRQEGSFAIANRVRGSSDYDLSGNTVLFHEYAHHFMFRYFTAPYPAWYIEGFAEFLSTAEFKSNGEWMLGKPAYHRAYGLHGPTDIPIERLLFEPPEPKSVADGDAYYARAWLLVHMLAMEPARSGQLRKFLGSVSQGMPHREAAAQAFGDLAELDKALNRYLGRPSMAVLNSKQAVVVDGPINIVELDPIASELVVLGLKRRLKGDPVKARDALQAFAAKAAGSDEVWYQLAQAEQRLVREGADEKVKAAAAAASETAVDRALAINPNHVRANVLKGRLQFEKLQAERDDRPTSWSKARAYVAKANAAANLDPEPLAAWYDSFAYQGKEPTKNASSGLELAFSLAPEVPDLRIKLAFDLARQGRFDEAIRLAEPLAFDPHDSEMGRTVLKTLKEMRGNAAEAKGEPLEPGKAQPSETKPASH